MDYLKKRLPYQIEFEFLPFEELKGKALAGKLNFILTNPYQAITIRELAKKADPPSNYWVILSLSQLEGERFYPFFGGVIFTRKDSPIKNLIELKGKTLGAVNPDSFGGYLIALYELYKVGIHEEDIKPKFYGTHDAVVRAVLKGEVPAGTVRTGILERMAKKGKISLRDLKILNQKNYPNFPFLVSSELYPEWPILALEGTPQKVIKELSKALLEIKEESSLAKTIEGVFYLPFDYEPVDKMLLDLQKGPYAVLREVYFERFKAKYLPYLIGFLLFFGALISLLVYGLYQRNKLLAQTKKLLEKEKTFLDTVLRHSDFMIFILNKEGIPLWANQKGERLCLEGEVSEPLWQICPVMAGLKSLQENLKNVLEIKRPINFIETIEVEGDEKSFEGEIIPILKGDEVEELLLFWRDITEKVVMEKQKLYLEKLNVLKNVAGGLAHDFNNKLLGIINQLELLKTHLGKRYSSPKVKKLFDELQKNLLSLRILGRELLTLVRGEAPFKEKINILELIKEYTNLSLAVKKNYEVVYEIEDPLPFVEVDKELFSIMWMNLIINACEAMPQGGKIIISVKPHYENGKPYVELGMKDEGVGIPERYLSKIFEPFFTTKPGGSGLGLYVVNEAVKAHEGKIEVYSKEGEGTTFKIYLPALEGEFISLKSKDSRGTKRLLLMDDDDLIRETLKELLMNFGYEVETAPDGESALEIFKKSLLEKTPFEFVILDLIVPGKFNGFETFQRMKELDPEVKVILISGYFDEPVFKQYRELGLKGALIKPFTIQQLLELLESN